MKQKIKVMAVDDGRFKRGRDEETFIAGVTTRGSLYIEEVKSARVKVDGLNSTNQIINIYNDSNSAKQSKAILLNGTTVAGFNVVNMKQLNEETKKPVIAAVRDKPSFERVGKAIRNTDNSEERLRVIDRNPEYKEHREIHYASIGIQEEEAEELLDKMTYRGTYPEPLRISHLIATSISETHGN